MFNLSTGGTLYGVSFVIYNYNMNEQQTAPNVESSKPRKTWFFERTGDNFIFACDELEAWALLNNRGRWMRNDFKMLGTSDGTTYYTTIRNSKSEMNDLLAQKQQLQQSHAKYSATEDRLRFEELKDDTDEMLQKVTKLLIDLNKQISEIDAQLSNFNKTLHDKAFKAELEVARGNIEYPSNHDIITPVQSDRNKIISNIKG